MTHGNGNRVGIDCGSRGLGGAVENSRGKFGTTIKNSKKKIKIGEFLCSHFNIEDGRK